MTIRMSKSYYTVNLPYTEEFGRYNRVKRKEFTDKMRSHRLYPLCQQRNSKKQADHIAAEMSRDLGLPLEVNETSALSF